MKVYADTSFIASLYILDVHSPAATAAMHSIKGVIHLSSLGEVELVNAIELRVFRREMSSTEAKAALRAFEEDLRQGTFAVDPFSLAAFDDAKRLARHYTARMGVRSLDLLHVAAALASKSNRFCSFDRDQRKLAHHVGLRLNPATL